MQMISFKNRIKNMYPHLNPQMETQDSALFQTVKPVKDLPAYPETEEELFSIIRSLPVSHHSSKPNKTVAVILAAGKGSRMGKAAPQKALCPVGGKPALLHTIETCKRCGIQDFLFVVGHGYQSVIETVNQVSITASFLFQDQALGTGHAARFASRFLQMQSYDERVLVLMGDKWITTQGLETLLSTHDAHKADMTITAGKKEEWEDSGRLVIDSGGVVRAIVERADIVLLQALQDFIELPDDPVPSQPFLEKIIAGWNRPQKIQKILGEPFWHQLTTMEAVPKDEAAFPSAPAGFRFSISDQLQFTGHEIEERCQKVNLSVYLFQAQPFYESMENLKADNAQGELYLTDAVQYLAAEYTVAAADMPSPYDVMGFNTPEELKHIESHIMDFKVDETQT